MVSEFISANMHTCIHNHACFCNYLCSFVLTAAPSSSGIVVTDPISRQQFICIVLVPGKHCNKGGIECGVIFISWETLTNCGPPYLLENPLSFLHFLGAIYLLQTRAHLRTHTQIYPSFYLSTYVSISLSIYGYVSMYLSTYLQWIYV